MRSITARLARIALAAAAGALLAGAVATSAQADVTSDGTTVTTVAPVSTEPGANTKHDDNWPWG